MELFDAIPSNLFSVLASPNKILYAKILFLVEEIFRNNLKIRKEELLSRVLVSFEDDIVNCIFEDEENNIKDNDISEKSRRLFKKLEQCKWIRVDYGINGFTEYITLPEYSQKILRTFKELTNNVNKKSFTYVYSTYSILKTADNDYSENEGFNKYTVLYEAYEKTEQLLQSLQTVYYNINKYNQEQLDLVNINLLLNEHFNSYRVDVVDKFIYPLKSRDSIVRYKSEIILIINKWIINDSLIEEMIKYALEDGKANTYNECRNDIKNKMFFIKDVYNEAEKKYIKEIDIKDREYTKTTTKKIRNIINSDESIQGYLIDIFNYFSLNNNENLDINKNKRKLKNLSNIYQIYDTGVLSEESLYIPRKRMFKKQIERKKVNKINKEFVKKAIDDLNKMNLNKYSQKYIFDYVENLLKNKHYYIIDKVENEEEYIKSLLVVVRANDNESKYKVKIEKNEFNLGNKYHIPKIIILRRN